MKKNKFLLFLAILSLALFSGGIVLSASPVKNVSQEIRRDATVQAIEKAMPTVVNISTETIVERKNNFDSLWRDFFGLYYGRKNEVRYSLGPGVIIDENGYILTNLHVVQQATRIWVSLSDGRKLEAEQISTLSGTDIALLKLKTEKSEKFSFIQFAQKKNLLLGETVIALGNPFGLGGSVTRGILSSKNRRPPVEGSELNIQDWLQIDAAINPGNSGGPLINLNGELIGLNVAIHSSGEGIGFAIPIRAVNESLSLLLTPENTAGLWFGGILQDKGQISFKSIELDSPAEKAGIKPNDILLEINEKPIKTLLEANREICQYGSGKTIQLLILRESKKLTLNIVLAAESDYFNQDYINRRLGIVIEKLTPQRAEQLGLQMLDSFVVMEVQTGSSADQIGLRPGMLICTVDGESKDNLISFAKALHLKNSGEKIRLLVRIQRRIGNFVEARNVETELIIK